MGRTPQAEAWLAATSKRAAKEPRPHRLPAAGGDLCCPQGHGLKLRAAADFELWWSWDEDAQKWRDDVIGVICDICRRKLRWAQALSPPDALSNFAKCQVCDYGVCKKCRAAGKVLRKPAPPQKQAGKAAPPGQTGKPAPQKQAGKPARKAAARPARKPGAKVGKKGVKPAAKKAAKKSSRGLRPGKKESKPKRSLGKKKPQVGKPKKTKKSGAQQSSGKARWSKAKRPTAPPKPPPAGAAKRGGAAQAVAAPARRRTTASGKRSAPEDLAPPAKRPQPLPQRARLPFRRALAEADSDGGSDEEGNAWATAGLMRRPSALRVGPGDSLALSRALWLLEADPHPAAPRDTVRPTLQQLLEAATARIARHRAPGGGAPSADPAAALAACTDRCRAYLQWLVLQSFRERDPRGAAREADPGDPPPLSAVHRLRLLQMLQLLRKRG
eukprot:TRINITY_DN65130_c0_g1_i1.p1 TRINITY_DN65130_c0_g1~~TRINITY_DN65130_c0_g1_i1.p1  ORF type:complete len:475 (+),score=127.84 TRINITY_DN65130_c0_g1_i1:101-1426(+)